MENGQAQNDVFQFAGYKQYSFVFILALYSSGNTFSSFSGITVEERDGSVVECFTQD